MLVEGLVDYTNTKFILHFRYKMEEFKQIEHIYEQFAQQINII